MGLKTEKIAIGAYSSELIALEWKRISASLKRLRNRKETAHKMYVRP